MNVRIKVATTVDGMTFFPGRKVKVPRRLLRRIMEAHRRAVAEAAARPKLPQVGRLRQR